MVKPVFPLHFICKRLRLSQCYLANKRFFSSRDDDQSSKLDSEHLTSLEKAEAKKELETLSKEEKKNAAKKKLFSLLSELEVATSDSKPIVSNLNLAKAVKRQSKEERLQKLVEEKKQNSPEGKIQAAAKAVAESIGGDPAKTLSELNEKLRLLNLAKAPTEDTEDVQEDIILDDESTKNIMSSVEEVASVVSDEATPIKSELTQRLLHLTRETKPSNAPKKSIDDLVKSMKVVEKTSSSPVETKGLVDRSRFNQRHHQRENLGMQMKINIFEAAPLDIFPLKEQAEVGSKQAVWQCLEEKELKLLTQFAPANAFEEMIMWTEQGKHWKLPVDNETEMGEEENVGFHEHVFLEKHLDGFPTKGPIYHFMELVLVGLSKNPYITVDRKIENINWFRDYFNEKEDILKESGALG